MGIVSNNYFAKSPSHQLMDSNHKIQFLSSMLIDSLLSRLPLYVKDSSVLFFITVVLSLKQVSTREMQDQNLACTDWVIIQQDLEMKQWQSIILHTGLSFINSTKQERKWPQRMERIISFYHLKTTKGKKVVCLCVCFCVSIINLSPTPLITIRFY